MDVNGSSRFPEQHELSPHQMNGGRFGNFQQMHGDQLLGGIIHEPLPPYNGDNGQGYLDDMINERYISKFQHASYYSISKFFDWFNILDFDLFAL